MADQFENIRKTDIAYRPLSNYDNFKDDVSQFEVFRTMIKELQPPHYHEYIQMWYVLKGSYKHHFNGMEFELGRGNLFIIPPAFGHFIDTSKSEDFELITCEFSEDFINSTPDGEERNTLFNLVYLEPVLITAQLTKPFLNFSGKAAVAIETLLEELHEEYSKRDKFFSTLVRANIIKLLALIAREYQAIATSEHDALFSKYRAAIQSALDYINGHFTEKIYLEEICKTALMSPSSFSYIFKQITGNTFTEYLQYLRILRARELLVTTENPQFDIFNECGFNDAVYFHRVFKKITGVSPGQYRKLNKEGGTVL